ncbi:MAG: Ig-like domain-containing protein [Eubacterium sp.]|nr:Ig-like domain-containing protein [Eubacterium sp.]
MKKVSIEKMIYTAALVLTLGVNSFGSVQAATTQQVAGQNQQVNPAGQAAKTKRKKATIKINKKAVTLNKDRSMKLKATKKNSAEGEIVWSSSKKRVASVDQNGNITAEGKGTAVITAKIKGTDVKATCKVEVQRYKLMRMRTTGYCNCRSCAGQWAGQPTASGRMPRGNHTIAVDPRLIKLGTKVQIGNIIYTAEDTGGAIKGHRIDVYYSSHSRATHHGVKYQTVKVFY